MTEETNWKNLVERAESRSKTVEGRSFVAEVRFIQKPFGAFDEELNALKLPPGETLEAAGDFRGADVPPLRRFYAVGKMADWFETIEPNKPYKLRLKVLFGTGTRPDNPDFLTTWHGYLIEGVEQEQRSGAPVRCLLWLLLLALNGAWVACVQADTAVEANLQFIRDQYFRYARSSNPADHDEPCIFLYQDYYRYGTYGTLDKTPNMAIDDNDPEAGQGTSSLKLTWSGTNSGYLQFVRPQPRAIYGTNVCGTVRVVRFLAKADVLGRQLTLNVFRVSGGSWELSATTNWPSLSTNWSDYSYDLDTNAMSPTNLHAVQFFMGQTSDPSARTVRLDEVRLTTDGYDPLRVVQSCQPLWASVTNKDITTTPAGRDFNFYHKLSYLYDNALAIQALLVSGRTNDTQTAQNIADAILAETNFSSVYYDERYAAHTLEADGKPRVPRDGNKARGLGPNSWFGLALLDLHNATGCPNYLSRAKGISDWAEAELKVTNSPLNGYLHGYDKDGEMFQGRSTEGNLDLFQLNHRLAAMLAAYGDTSATNYTVRADHAGTFVLAMYNTDGGWFWTGTDTNDVVNTNTIPLDVQFWPYLTLGQCPEYASKVNFLSPIRWAETNLMRTNVVTCIDSCTNVSFAGFTYSSRSGSNVWFEGCASAAVAYRLSGDTVQEQNMLRLLELARTNGCNHDPNGEGQIAASSDGLHDTCIDAWYDARLAVGPTAWTYFARMGINPFALPSLPFVVIGGNTQVVCRPFGLRVAATDPCGAFTNVAILQDSWTVASASAPPLETTMDIDLPGAYLFRACAQDNKGITNWATQTVTLVTYPLHVLVAGGFRTNGGFKICMAGETGRNYQVLVNSYLNTGDWIGLGLMESTNGIWRFSDLDATNHAHRFYRVESLP